MKESAKDSAKDSRKEGRSRKELHDRLVHVRRVSKVLKGGRQFNFSATVVVGDLAGRVGYGHGKARDISEAIRKATESAKKNLVRIPLKENRTIPHDVSAKDGAGRVILRGAPPGTGIIAGGVLRSIFEVLGIQDVVAKSLGSSNKTSMLRATFEALRKLDSPRSVATRRGKKVSDLVLLS